ncbi:MAG: type II toxin-antitoxin system YafO family toxin [Alteromonadaceae bacterium]|nr:type II toxin-antitoxin system YafO family toxin [Alteromonadaceae bacterium]
MGREDKPLPLKKIQFYQTSDVHLVYCQGALNDNFYVPRNIHTYDIVEVILGFLDD